MMPAPMLADFAVRLAFGLSIATVLVSWRTVPLPFFRTQEQIVLALLALAALDQARASGTGISFWMIVSGGVLAYVSSIAWGLGLPGAGRSDRRTFGGSGTPLAVLGLRQCRPTFAGGERGQPAGFGLSAGVSPLLDVAGALLLDRAGNDDRPAQRTITFIAWGLAARAVLAGIGLAILRAGPSAGINSASEPDAAVLYLGRWGMGFLAAGIATYMTWKTARIRSTQSATGILYIAMIFVLFGELSSLVLSARHGVIC